MSFSYLALGFLYLNCKQNFSFVDDMCTNIFPVFVPSFTISLVSQIFRFQYNSSFVKFIDYTCFMAHLTNIFFHMTNHKDIFLCSLLKF